MQRPREFPQRATYRPSYLQDKTEAKDIRLSLMKDINKGGGGRALHEIEQSKELRCLSTEVYVPVKDPNRIYEVNQIEKRFKLQFHQAKLGYSNEYLSKFSELLTQRSSKDYLPQRKLMIEKYQPLSFLFNTRNTKGTFYLTENQKTIQSQKAFRKKAPDKKFVYFPITRNSEHIERRSGSTDDNAPSVLKKENEKEVIEFLEPIDDTVTNFEAFPEREEVERKLKAAFNFIETEKSRTRTHAVKKMFNPGNVLRYFKNTNPSKVEYLKRIIITQKELPSVLSHDLLPLLQGFKSTRNQRRGSYELFKTA